MDRDFVRSKEDYANGKLQWPRRKYDEKRAELLSSQAIAASTLQLEACATTSPLNHLKLADFPRHRSGKYLPITSSMLRGRNITELELQAQMACHIHRQLVKDQHLPPEVIPPPSIPAPEAVISDPSQVGEETEKTKTMPSDVPSAQTMESEPNMFVPGQFQVAAAKSYPTPPSNTPRDSPCPLAVPISLRSYKPNPVRVSASQGSSGNPAPNEDPVLDGPTYKHQGWTCCGCSVGEITFQCFLSHADKAFT